MKYLINVFLTLMIFSNCYAQQLENEPMIKKEHIKKMRELLPAPFHGNTDRAISSFELKRISRGMFFPEDFKKKIYVLKEDNSEWVLFEEATDADLFIYWTDYIKSFGEKDFEEELFDELPEFNFEEFSEENYEEKSDNPLLNIASEMQEVANSLRNKEVIIQKQEKLLTQLDEFLDTSEENPSDSPTSIAQQQKEIVEKLDQLIAQHSNGGGGSGNNQGKGTQKTSNLSQKPGNGNVPADNVGHAEPQTPQLGPKLPNSFKTKYWGHLPPHMQQEAASMTADSFVPKYSHLIEKYFKALSKPQN